LTDTPLTCFFNWGTTKLALSGLTVSNSIYWSFYQTQIYLYTKLAKARFILKSPSSAWMYRRRQASSLVLTSFASSGHISRPPITNDTPSPLFYPTLQRVNLCYYV
jgi:hypothetical protein